MYGSVLFEWKYVSSTVGAERLMFSGLSFGRPSVNTSDLCDLFSTSLITIPRGAISLHLMEIFQ